MLKATQTLTKFQITMIGKAGIHFTPGILTQDVVLNYICVNRSAVCLPGAY